MANSGLRMVELGLIMAKSGPKIASLGPKIVNLRQPVTKCNVVEKIIPLANRIENQTKGICGIPIQGTRSRGHMTDILSKIKAAGTLDQQTDIQTHAKTTKIFDQTLQQLNFP